MEPQFELVPLQSCQFELVNARFGRLPHRKKHGQQAQETVTRDAWQG